MFALVTESPRNTPSKSTSKVQAPSQDPNVWRLFFQTKGSVRVIITPHSFIQSLLYCLLFHEVGLSLRYPSVIPTFRRKPGDVVTLFKRHCPPVLWTRTVKWSLMTGDTYSRTRIFISIEMQFCFWSEYREFSENLNVPTVLIDIKKNVLSEVRLCTHRVRLIILKVWNLRVWRFQLFIKTNENVSLGIEKC